MKKMKNNPTAGLPLPQEGLEEILGHRFNDPELLKEALCHSSYYNEQRGKGADAYCNERLEFLGDYGDTCRVFADRFLGEGLCCQQEDRQ